MKQGLFNYAIAFSGGCLLALMIASNSELAKYSSAVGASWIAHLVGTIVSLILMVITTLYFSIPNRISPHRKIPIWAYSGGVFGAFTVVLAAITVNSQLGLAVTIALVMFGQLLFGLVSDYYGLFGSNRKKPIPKDILGICITFIGCILMIMGAQY
ncbi:MAG: DMT family transporter [Psychrobium sp.]